MPLNSVPTLSFTDVTGVVDATAAAEIVTAVTLLKTLIPTTDHPAAQTTPPNGQPPHYDLWPPALASEFVRELDALAAAIAAAPTS